MSLQSQGLIFFSISLKISCLPTVRMYLKKEKKGKKEKIMMRTPLKTLLHFLYFLYFLFSEVNVGDLDEPIG